MTSDLSPHIFQKNPVPRSLEDIYRIQVVFHIVGNETLLNSIDDTELSQLLYDVNMIYSGRNNGIINVRPEFIPIIGQANIEFILNDVVRVESDEKYVRNLFGSENTLENAKNDITGGSSPYNVERFLNIWICDIFTSSGEDNNFTLGYGTPPEGMPGWPENDFVQGILLNEHSFTDPFVLAHEIGHFCGFKNIFLKFLTAIAWIMMELVILPDPTERIVAF